MMIFRVHFEFSFEFFKNNDFFLSNMEMRDRSLVIVYLISNKYEFFFL